ncbi:uncharacterized protein C8R40DRAFT_646166 [Lentinula edodes]|uniref:uncharacterized protein n=1 Tax=Lentinula edodes TaxID=5353 RepID=UPI001E8DAC76|nr:uncharacterized protein C8R40DRAFT_646166 [Lentinula edodes]KAH7870405.1 hypothetical protein C8R40DRAFT_646166 [Lentinula edodes]
MEISSRDTFVAPRSSQKRHSSSPSPPSARTTLSRLHSHSRSLDLQHDTALRSSKASSYFPTPELVINRSNKTSRIMSSVRKSLFISHPATQNSKKQLPIDSANAMSIYSTPAERTIQHSTRIKRQDPYASPPSIEQIAMGLHISRTPHLRPPPVSNNLFPGDHTPIPLPPPPSRSAMKKTGQPNSLPPSLDPHSVSSTTIASSNLPPTPRSNRSLLSLKLRMSRLLSSNQSSSMPPSTLPSPTASSQDTATNFVPPRKAVRFSTSTLDLSGRDEQ